MLKATAISTGKIHYENFYVLPANIICSWQQWIAFEKGFAERIDPKEDKEKNSFSIYPNPAGIY